MKYHFEWKSGYMGTVDYMVTDSTGTFRASLRTELRDYERSILNPHAPNIVRDVESAIGLLVRSVCDNCGEILPETIDAFNAWRASEHASQMAHMRANPDRYGTEFNEPWFQPPKPVRAGRWTAESGWTPVRTEESA
jgi:hypothetical protein